MHPSIVAILSSGLSQPLPIYYTPLPHRRPSPSPSISSLSHRIIHHKKPPSSPSFPLSPLPPPSNTHQQQMFSVSSTAPNKSSSVSITGDGNRWKESSSVSHAKDSDAHESGDTGGNMADDNYFMIGGKDQQTQTHTDQPAINHAPPTFPSLHPSDHYQTKQVWMVSSCVNPLYGAPTLERPVAEYCEKTIPSAGIGRALAAPSIDTPHGSVQRFPLQPKPAKKAKYALWPNVADYARDPPAAYDRTVLQQHIDYWDVNNDGIITISETFVGLRALGFSLFNCILGTFVIHSMMSYPTSESWIPDYRFRIYVKNIHRGKHGSDAQVFDTEGRFIPQKFEDLFSKFDRGHRNYLTLSDIKNLWIVDRNPFDVIGVIATIFEFGFLWLLAADDEGRLWKEDLRANYDGTLFYRIAKSRLSASKHAIIQNSDNSDHNDSDHSYASIMLLIGAGMYAVIVSTLSVLYIMISR